MMGKEEELAAMSSRSAGVAAWRWVQLCDLSAVSSRGSSEGAMAGRHMSVSLLYPSVNSSCA